MNHYQHIFPIDRPVAERKFSTNEAEEICYAMISVALYEQDWKWAQDKCLYFLMSDNPEISGLAANCLGHIARIHRQIEKDKVVPLLQSRLHDTRIAGRVDDALIDIEMFT